MCLTEGFKSGFSGKLKTDFKTWLKVDKILRGDESYEDKIIAVLGLVYTSLPQKLSEALDEIFEFYSDGRGKSNKTPCARCFDFEYDAELILSAFRQQYGINLLKEELHWHEFLALLKGLTADTLFVRTVYIRCIDLSEIKDKERRRKIAALKKEYALAPSEKEKKENEELINMLKNRR